MNKTIRALRKKRCVMNTNVSFGRYLTQKREERRITLRNMATMLGVSAPYLSDVEHDRRNPLEMQKLKSAMKILELSEADQEELLDLAGRGRNTVAPDLPEYIMERSYVSSALRRARDMGASEEEWLQFVEQLEKRRG